MDARTPLEVADVTDEFLDSVPLDGPFRLLDREALAHFKHYLKSQYKRRFQYGAVMPPWMERDLNARLSKLERMCDNAEEYYRSMAAGRGTATAGGGVSAERPIPPAMNPNLSRATCSLWERLQKAQKRQTFDDMETWGFSRKTVRNAVKELDAAGYITRCKGGGVLPKELK